MHLKLVLPVFLLAAWAIASPAEENPIHRHAAATAATGPQRIIVKFRSQRAASRVSSQSEDERVGALSARARVLLRQRISISADLQAMHVEPVTSGELLGQILERLQADPDVEFAVADQRRYAQTVPNDPLYSGQWYLKDVEAAAIDAESAWDLVTGSKGVVVAVVDTGVRYEHPDLKRATGSGRLLPGYDFVSGESGGTFRAANDGNGRDSDPSDPGDWVTATDTDSSLFKDCEVSDSSWHGTRVSGIIGALSNNNVGITGIAWSTWLLPVRVLGKCGGFDSDVIAGMRWAAGLHVSGVPDNPYPARIINMSLGAEGTCTPAYQSVVDELTAHGVLVVVSAGNEGGPVDTPANCDGVAGIAGLRQIGTKVGFSSLGPEIALSAPGGNCVNTGGGPCLFSIDTTSNSGAKTPGSSVYTDQTHTNVGTSFSAPIVSGIAALMLAENGNLDSSQLIARLQEGATKPFPKSIDVTVPNCHVPAGPADIQNDECNCTTSTCGAGMANARGSVEAALRPIAAIAVSGVIAPGQDVTLDGSASAAACHHSVSAYSWKVVSGTGVISSGADTSTAHVNAPATGSFTVELTVTDEAGLQDKARVVLRPTSATTSAPSNAGTEACPRNITVAQSSPDPSTPPPKKSGDGGGGVLDLLWLLTSLFSLSVAAQRRRTARLY